MSHKTPRWLEKVWFFALLITPIILWVLPANYFDNGKIIFCPSRLFFNIECFSCGMTRAIMHLHHLDFEGAIFYNIGCILAYPALGVIWLIWTLTSAKNLDILSKDVKLFGLLD